VIEEQGHSGLTNKDSDHADSRNRASNRPIITELHVGLRLSDHKFYYDGAVEVCRG